MKNLKFCNLKLTKDMRKNNLDKFYSSALCTTKLYSNYVLKKAHYYDDGLLYESKHNGRSG